MRSLALSKWKALSVLAAVVAVVAAVAVPSAFAASITVDLCAKAGTVDLPGLTGVPIWGFAQLGPSQTCSDVQAQLPGPVIEVNLNDDVTVNVTVDASLSGHDVSFELPGLSVTNPVAGSFQFTADRVGTFGYQSPGDAGRQMAMGLYGALVVRPASEPAGFSTGNCSPVPGSAYGNAFDRECALVLSAIDPDFNADPDNFDMNGYLATFWMINGKAYPDTDPIPAATTDDLLLRYVNAGFDNTTMAVLGMHEHVIARDAHTSPSFSPYDADAETIPGGATEDAIIQGIPTYDASSFPNGFPLYNGQMHLTNGTASNPSYQVLGGGGMMTFIQTP